MKGWLVICGNSPTANSRAKLCVRRSYNVWQTITKNYNRFVDE
jgi:hypothetical protein